MTDGGRLYAADRSSQGILLLDGGLGTHLKTLGAQFGNSPVWSSQALISAPKLIRQAHLDFYLAGADVAFTATYQASLKGLTLIGLSATEAVETVQRAVILADEARQAAMAGGSASVKERDEDAGDKDVINRGRESSPGSLDQQTDQPRQRKLKVILSNGSYGAALGGGEEYRGNYGVPDEEIQAFHRWRLQAALQSSPGLLDAVVFETLPESAEAKAILSLLREFPDLRGKVWFSFTCGIPGCDAGQRRSPTSLSNGENFREVVAEILRLDARNRFLSAVGVNCSPVALMRPLLCEPSLLQSLAAPLQKDRDVTDLLTLCYPNNEPWRNPSGACFPTTFEVAAARTRFAFADRSSHSTESWETAATDRECQSVPSRVAGRFARVDPVVPFGSSVRETGEVAGAAAIHVGSKTVVRHRAAEVRLENRIQPVPQKEGARGNQCEDHPLASHVKSWIDGGVTAVGGCCGTSPEDLTAVVGVLKREGLR